VHLSQYMFTSPLAAVLLLSTYTAVRARFERESTNAIYEVHVLKDAKITNVHVSVDDGKVLNANEMMAHHKGQMRHQETQHQTDEKPQLTETSA